MFVKQSKSKDGRIYLSFVQSYRHDGKNKQRTIEKIGYLDELEKKYDDPLTHFKEVAKERSSLPTEETFTFNLNEHVNKDIIYRKNVGYSILSRLYDRLNIDTLLSNISYNEKTNMELNNIFSLLIYNRFLLPSSKKNAYDTKDVFFQDFNFSLKDIYRSLDIFSKYSDEIQKHIYNNIENILSYDKSVSYYDVTNYYFEIPYNDVDETNDNNEIIKKGLRKKGPSKENRKSPIVQMGLLMDNNGIPMAYNLFPSNESEKTSLLPTVRKIKREYNLNRMIIVADRGINTSDNTYGLSGTNDEINDDFDGYVYGQSIKQGDQDFKNWALDSSNLICDKYLDKNNDEIVFKHKSRIIKKAVTIKSDKTNRNVKKATYQKQMVYYSQKYADKQRKERSILIQKSKDLINNPAKYNKATAYGAAAYVKNINFDKETGEVLKSKLSLNISKIKEEEKYDGYYSIVTSEIEMSDKQMRDTYKGLWEIEESFRILKSEFSARPVYVRTEEHINAHFLVCFITLVMARLLKKEFDNKYSITNIRESILKCNCTYLDMNKYLFDYNDDFIEEASLKYNMTLTKRIQSRSDIKKYFKKIK